jgi:hypothetical protein
MQISDDNPTGIETFDHRDISDLPEYAAASEALNALIGAIIRAEISVSMERWLEMVQQMASALAYPDMCQSCVKRMGELRRSGEDMGDAPTRAPDGVHVMGDQLRASYFCPACSSRWTRGYAVQYMKFL